MNKTSLQLPSHLLTIKALSKESILSILEKAEYYLQNYIEKSSSSHLLAEAVVANLFFESSTRTRNSFEIAAKRLGAMVLSPAMQSSSLLKGESLLDTIQNLVAMGVSIFVIRHGENGIPEWLANRASAHTTFINAGDGTHQHPTQALTDLLTIQQHHSDWSSLRITIIGDIIHSRVAHSLLDALQLMGVLEIRLVGPLELLPNENLPPKIKVFHQLNDALPESDVIVTLRIQKERMQGENTPDSHAFYQQYGLTREKLALAKPTAIVMHPGPMNRGIEIDSEVADGAQSVILKQVRNGVAIRMAVLSLFGAKSHLPN